MSFSFYFIFRTKLEKAEAHGREIHIHIRKHLEGGLILMRTCVMDLLLHRKREKKKKKSHSSSQNHPWFSPEPLIRECYSHVRLNQSCIPGLKKLFFSNLSTSIDMIILTPLCALHVFLSTGAIPCLDCSEVHHHVSLEEKLPRAVPLVQHFYNWKKRVSFLHLSLS